MKRTLLILLLLSVITNCADKKPESDKELKDTLRHYLKATLNDPKSYEEVDWSIFQAYSFKKVNENDFGNDSPMKITYDGNQSDSKYVMLEYRAKNSYNALVKNYEYAIYMPKSKTIYVDGIAYSIEKGNLGNVGSDSFNPKKGFLLNRFYLIKNGKGTYNQFLEEYPEFIEINDLTLE